MILLSNNLNKRLNIFMMSWANFGINGLIILTNSKISLLISLKISLLPMSLSRKGRSLYWDSLKLILLEENILGIFSITSYDLYSKISKSKEIIESTNSFEITRQSCCPSPLITEMVTLMHLSTVSFPTDKYAYYFVSSWISISIKF